jgi:hypothetical protein
MHLFILFRIKDKSLEKEYLSRYTGDALPQAGFWRSRSSWVLDCVDAHHSFFDDCSRQSSWVSEDIMGFIGNFSFSCWISNRQQNSWNILRVSGKLFPNYFGVLNYLLLFNWFFFIFRYMPPQWVIIMGCYTPHYYSHGA